MWGFVASTLVLGLSPARAEDTAHEPNSPLQMSTQLTYEEAPSSCADDPDCLPPSIGSIGILPDGEVVPDNVDGIVAPLDEAMTMPDSTASIMKALPSPVEAGTLGHSIGSGMGAVEVGH